MKWPLASAAGALAVIGAGGASMGLWMSSGSSLDADERALVEQVESGAHANSRDAVRFVDDNIEILLSKDVSDEVDGTDLAALFEVALSTDGGDGVFEKVVATVREEGSIHSPELRPVLGEAAGMRLAWFDARINAFTSDNSDEWSDLRVAYDAAFAFLRETMREQAVAERLRGSMADYGRREVAAAPEAGEERAFRLLDMGSFQAFFTLAYYEAEEHEARLDGNIDAVEAAEEADFERRQEDVVDRAMWVALDRFESDPAIRAAAVGEPFADASGALKSDLTDSEAEALDAWPRTRLVREVSVPETPSISLLVSRSFMRDRWCVRSDAPFAEVGAFGAPSESHPAAASGLAGMPREYSRSRDSARGSRSTRR